MGEISLQIGAAEAQSLGTLGYSGHGNYEATAGVFEPPVDRSFTDAELTAISQNSLILMMLPPGAAAPSALGAERDDGAYLRAERFVFRLDQGESAKTDLFATRFGAPFANATPQVLAFPFSALDNLPLPDVEVSPKTDAKGRATLTITGINPGNPRSFLDGLVYGVVCLLKESQADPNVVINAERNFISILNFDPLPPIAAPAWNDVRAIFKQYGDLYPRPHGPANYAPFDGLPPSHPVVDLADQNSVMKFARHILWALELPIEQPNHMPVTRDLSNEKRKRLIAWLRGLGIAGVPAVPIAMGAAQKIEAKGPLTRSKTITPVVNVGLLRHRP
jgi:hypothetical protein